MPFVISGNPAGLAAGLGAKAADYREAVRQQQRQDSINQFNADLALREQALQQQAQQQAFNQQMASNQFAYQRAHDQQALANQRYGYDVRNQIADITQAGLNQRHQESLDLQKANAEWAHAHGDQTYNLAMQQFQQRSAEADRQYNLAVQNAQSLDEVRAATMRHQQAMEQLQGARDTFNQSYRTTVLQQDNARYNAGQQGTTDRFNAGQTNEAAAQQRATDERRLRDLSRIRPDLLTPTEQAEMAALQERLSVPMNVTLVKPQRVAPPAAPSTQPPINRPAAPIPALVQAMGSVVRTGHDQQGRPVYQLADGRVVYQDGTPVP